MTLPDERYRAVVQTRRFLFDICNPEHTPRVPKLIRDTARSLLRHYPNEYDMSKTAQTSPDIFQKQMEPVTKLFKQYEQSKAGKNET
jgi:hypothetical protein